MDGWDFVLGIVNVIPRLPLEKFFEREGSKDFDALEKRLKSKGFLESTETTTNSHSHNEGASTIAVAPKSNEIRHTEPVALPTTQETLEELRRRLGKELYKAELDLTRGLRIAGKPCDCLDQKHSLMLEAAAEEMMSYEHNPVYGEIIAWLRQHQQEFPPEQIMKHPPEYYRRYVPQFRNFRKRVMGTQSASTKGDMYITSSRGDTHVTPGLNSGKASLAKAKPTKITMEQAQVIAAKIVSEEVEREWKAEKGD